MRKRIPLIIAILWVVFVIAMAVAMGGKWPGRTPDFVSLSNSYESGSSFTALCYSEDHLYALLTPLSSTDYEGSRIVCISTDGAATTATPTLTFEDGGEITGLGMASDCLYVAVVLDDGNRAGLYYVGMENLSEDNLKKSSDTVSDNLSLSLVRTIEAVGGRTINWAGYVYGAFLTWQDDGSGLEYYEKAMADEAYCEQILDDLGQTANTKQFNAIAYIVLLFAGLLVIIVASRILRGKSHTFYVAALVVVVVFAVTMVGAVLVAGSRRDAQNAQMRRYSSYCLNDVLKDVNEAWLLRNLEESDFYQSSAYGEIYGIFSDFIADDNVGDIFLDICIVRADDGRIIVSASGRNGRPISDVYGQDIYVMDITNVEGESSAYQLAAVMRDTGAYLFSDTASRMYLIYALIVFVVASVVCVMLLRARGRELSQLSSAMRKASAGQKVPMAKNVRSHDVVTMWNSFMEMQKNIDRGTHKRYEVYESWARFAPKNIEKLFGRYSIMEIDGGDTKQLRGMLAFVTTAEPKGEWEKSAAQINRYMTVLQSTVEECGGYYIAGNADLTDVELLFAEDNRRTVDFAALLLEKLYAESALSSMRPGVFLHNCKMLYGVAGTGERCFPFVVTDEKKELFYFSNWFRRMRLRLVITSDVLRREKYTGDVRFIGYIYLKDSASRLDIYEVLDACPAKERRPKIETAERFSKALELFYQHDFYLARNGFSDVLKLSPADLITRWYLFSCEKYLNESPGDGDDVCSLRYDDDVQIL